MQVGFILYICYPNNSKPMELTKENLEYIIFVAREYCYPNKQQLKDCDTIRDAGDMAESAATSTFRQRYPLLIEEYKDAYERYTSNADIQETLNAYKLNPDKFWLLFLFIADFTNSCFSYSTKIEPTFRELLQDIADTIYNDDDVNITISSEKKSISSSSPLLLTLFAHSCSELINKTDPLMESAYYEVAKVTEEKVRTRKTKFFVELFRYFLYNHTDITTEQPSRMSFIGKFLYLSKIVKDKEFYYTGYRLTSITPETPVTKFLIKRYGTIIWRANEYIKEPEDVGKDIADTIKKCQNYSPISTSNYFCAPF